MIKIPKLTIYLRKYKHSSYAWKWNHRHGWLYEPNSWTIKEEDILGRCYCHKKQSDHIKSHKFASFIIFKCFIHSNDIITELKKLLYYSSWGRHFVWEHWHWTTHNKSPSVPLHHSPTVTTRTTENWPSVVTPDKIQKFSPTDRNNTSCNSTWQCCASL